MKSIILALALMNSAFAGLAQDSSILASKLAFERQAFALKQAHEREVNRIQHKDLSSLLGSTNKASESDCVDWVYQGPSTREEAIQICRGVRSLECAQWVYQGPSSRVESIEACRGVRSLDCAQWVYQGPSSRVESVEACRGNVDMDCARQMYQGPSSRLESVEACRDGGRPRPRPNDCRL